MSSLKWAIKQHKQVCTKCNEEFIAIQKHELCLNCQMKRLGHILYPHRFKFGKQKAIMTLDTFKAKLEASNLSLAKKAFVVLLWHTGARKSEAYELPRESVMVTPEHVVVDFGKRKKGGEDVPPLRIPRAFYGLEKILVPYIKGKRTRLLFPHIKADTAWRTVKQVLGEEYYPHYLRLRKLSEVGKHYGITHVKAISGIKSLKALEAYIGFDEKTQKEAMEVSE